jgi:hypothetical protein
VLDILNRVPGVNVYVDILKVIVYNGEKITNQLQFEADALDVHLFSFDVKLKAEVNGPWSFTKEYRETLSKIYDDAGQTHPFSEMAEYFKVHGDDPGVEAEFSVNGSTPEGADVSREVEDDQG